MLFNSIIGPLVLALIIIVGIAFGIKKTAWPTKNKKWAFSLLAAFLIFPQIAPAGTIAFIPLPNITLLIALVLHGLKTAPGIIAFLIQTWMFALPSFLITALIMRGIAACIFFEKTADPTA